MAKLENAFMMKYLNQVERTPYVANNLANLIDKIEKVYSDNQLQLIKSIINNNIVLESSCRTPYYGEIEIVRGCIYNLDTWLVNNDIKYPF
ncbi:hypothetical protein [Myroides sp. N17-2]|uniref:hypothetical protein n=1 Tax=Myroides sp. N17-2 TaxID=2030799 RepID=UPI000EFA5D80|nr:hypothetical protein [Myroides sp. N17-2]